MQPPKVVSVCAVNTHVLLVEFNNQQKKHYDVARLWHLPMFNALKNHDIFKNVRVEQGGYAVLWNDDIDLSEHELWQHGEAI